MQKIIVPWANLNFAWEKDYENEIWNEITVPYGGVAIDIGAHYGFYTTKMAKEAGEFGKVIAFEPDVVNRSILENNLLQNNLKAMIYDCALSDYQGCGELFTYRQNKNDSGKHFLRGSFDKQVYNYEYYSGQSIPGPQIHKKVKVMMLDQLELLKVDLIKMDVEGAEIKVINGAINTLKRTRPKIVIEVHFGLIEELQNLLKTLGYKMTKFYPKVTYTTNPFAVFERCD